MIKTVLFAAAILAIVVVGCGESLGDAADVEDPEPEFVACMEERFGPDHRREWEGMYAIHAEGVDLDEGYILTGHTYGCWEIEGAPPGLMRR